MTKLKVTILLIAAFTFVDVDAGKKKIVSKGIHDL